MASKNNLKIILQKEGIRQIELAEAAKVSPGSVNRTCNNKRTPSITMCNKMIKALNSLAGKNYKYDDVFPK